MPDARRPDDEAQAVGFEHEIRAYMQDCLDSGDCPFTGELEDALSTTGRS